MVALLERPGAGEAPRHPPPAQDHCVAAKISHKAPPRPFPASAGDRIVPCRPDGRPWGMSFRGPRRMLTDYAARPQEVLGVVSAAKDQCRGAGRTSKDGVNGDALRRGTAGD